MIKCPSFSFLEVGRQGQTRFEDTHNEMWVKFNGKRLQTIVKKEKKGKNKSTLVLGINNADTMLG